jgi:hypothetical protein
VTDPQSWADFHNMPFIKADASDALKDWAGKTLPALEPHLEMVGAALPGPRVERWHRWRPQAKFKEEPLNVLGRSPARHQILAGCDGLCQERW